MDIFGEILLYLLLSLCRVDPVGLQVHMNNTLLTKIIACHLRWQGAIKFIMKMNKWKNNNI